MTEIEQIKQIISNSTEIQKYEKQVYELLDKRNKGEITEKQMLEEIKKMNLGDGFWALLLLKALY